MKRLLCLSLLLSLLLSACATDPLSAKERREREARQQIEHRAQMVEACDPLTAYQMRYLRDYRHLLSPDEQKKMEKEIEARFADTTFQACYRLAIENFQQRQYLRELRRQRDFDHFFWRNSFFYYPYPYGIYFVQPKKEESDSD